MCIVARSLSHFYCEVLLYQSFERGKVGDKGLGRYLAPLLTSLDILVHLATKLLYIHTRTVVL